MLLQNVVFAFFECRLCFFKCRLCFLQISVWKSSFSYFEIILQVLVFFIILILLWFFQSPKFIPGWADQFKASGENHNSLLVYYFFNSLCGRTMCVTSINEKANIQLYSIFQIVCWRTISQGGGGATCMRKGCRAHILRKVVVWDDAVMASTPSYFQLWCISCFYGWKERCLLT